MIGDTGNDLTVLLLPDCEGVVPFRLGKLANISKNGIRRRPGRIAGFAAPRTVESVEKPRDEEGYTQESEMRMVEGVVHLWGGCMQVTRQRMCGVKRSQISVRYRE